LVLTHSGDNRTSGNGRIDRGSHASKQALEGFVVWLAVPVNERLGLEPAEGKGWLHVVQEGRNELARLQGFPSLGDDPFRFDREP
jgi:hypothetical protein